MTSNAAESISSDNLRKEIEKCSNQSNRTELTDLLPSRSDRTAYNVSAEFELQSEHKPYCESHPHLLAHAEALFARAEGSGKSDHSLQRTD
jgi:hypothetical protein